MIDERDDTMVAVAQLIIAMALFILVLFLSGCAIFDSSGQAKYSLEPVILQDGESKERAVCCRVSINNSKNIGLVSTTAKYNPTTGEFTVTLDEEGVDAQGPAAAAAKAQTEVIRSLIPLVK